MSDDTRTRALQELLEINQQIGLSESDADGAYFEMLLHPRFTMRRPAGQLSSKAEFIAGLAPGARRRTTVLAIELHGDKRATARCRVDKWALTDPEAVQVFDNLRVFIRSEGRWQLICWLTEPI